MKIAILCAVILSAATAAAETIIVEYPDHYYVESAGTSESAPPAEAVPVPVPGQESIVLPPATAKPVANAKPVTNFDVAPQPVDPAERRASMEKEIERLQRERSDLLAPREGETPEQAARRQHLAQGMLRKINKMSSELLKTP